MALYTAVFNAVAVTAQQDLFEIVSASDAITIIHAIELSQSTEIGDAMEEGLNILVKRGATVSGSGGSTVTPTALEAAVAAAYGGTVASNNTTKANTGTISTLRADNWNVRMPYLWLPTPEMRIVVGPSVRLTVELATTPADSITMSGTITFEELG